MLEPDGDAEDGKAVSEIGGAIERIHVPAEVAAGLVPRAFFADHVMPRPAGADAVDDELLGLAVGDRDQVDVALIFHQYATGEVVKQERSGLARDSGNVG